MAVSLKELAQAVGLSTSTVSRALNGYADVKPATRERVFQAARELGYQPNPTALRLVTGKTGCIGLVTSVLSGTTVDLIFSTLLAGIGKVLQPMNYYVVATAFPVGQDEMALFERFIGAGFVDGLILARTRADDPRIKLLLERNIPFVTYGRSETCTQHGWVDTDGERAMALATQRLVELGHRRIALINGWSAYYFAGMRRKGYEQTLLKAGIPLDPELIRHCDLVMEDGYRAARELLTRPQRPTAIVCANDVLSQAALAAMRDLGLHPRRDVSLIGFGNAEISRMFGSQVTTVEHDTEAHGEELARLLLARMKGHDPVELNVLHGGMLCIRDTDGPPAAD